jgi:hypothetical protein
MRALKAMLPGLECRCKRLMKIINNKCAEWKFGYNKMLFMANKEYIGHGTYIK